MKKPQSQLSLLNGGLFQGRKRSKNDVLLSKINEVVDWSRLENLIKESKVSSKNKKGRPSIPPLQMIKILFLQYLYNLSDSRTEDALIDYLSFRRFVGIPLEDEIPDFTTIWRFRDRLSRQGLYQPLIKEIIMMLNKEGIELRQGRLVNATMVEISHRSTNTSQEKKQTSPE